MNIRISLLVFMMFLPFSALAVDFYNQVEKIHFDSSTYTEYNNIDRIHPKSSSGYALGHTTLLSFFRDDDLLRTITIKGMEQAQTRGMKNDIWHIEYLDKDRVWIISGFGRHFSNSVLYNTLTDKNDAHYSGKNPLISPGRKHVAYRVPSGHIPSPDYVDHVFIDDVMVYPELVYDMTIEKISYSSDETANNFYEFRPDNLKLSWIGENFSWSEDGSTLTILANEEIANDKDETSRRYYNIQVHIADKAAHEGDDHARSIVFSRAFSVTIEKEILSEAEYNRLKK